MVLPVTETEVPGGLTAVLFYLVAYGAMTIGAFAVLAYLSTPQRPVETVDDLAGSAPWPGAVTAGPAVVSQLAAGETLHGLLVVGYPVGRDRPDDDRLQETGGLDRRGQLRERGLVHLGARLIRVRPHARHGKLPQCARRLRLLA